VDTKLRSTLPVVLEGYSDKFVRVIARHQPYVGRSPYQFSHYIPRKLLEKMHKVIVNHLREWDCIMNFRDMLRKELDCCPCDLAKEFNTNPTAVRLAFRYLVENSYILGRHGNSFFVKDPWSTSCRGNGPELFKKDGLKELSNRRLELNYC
jgi:hypothetical protein